MTIPAFERPDSRGSPGPEREPDLRLSDVPLHECVELVDVRLPPEEAEPLFERGLLPGCELRRVRRSPFGDPVIEVDGALLAVRRETARGLRVRRLPADR